MDQLQNHIITLEEKIDRLYAVVEHLSNRVEESLERSETAGWKTTNAEMSDLVSDPPHRGFSAMMGHKDILSDDDTKFKNTASDGEEISAEIKIRRLNAQLTAAYNRIGALEEQLLAQRIQF